VPMLKLTAPVGAPSGGRAAGGGILVGAGLVGQPAMAARSAPSLRCFHRAIALRRFRQRSPSAGCSYRRRGLLGRPPSPWLRGRRVSGRRV